MASEGLEHTHIRSEPTVFVASRSGGQSRSALIDMHGERKTREHGRALQHLVRATAGAKFESKIFEVGCVDGALAAAKNFCLPSTDMEKEVLQKQVG